MSKSIIVDLESCVGCWTCAMACKMGRGKDVDDFPLYIETLGDGTGIDEPAGVYPNLTMSRKPVFTKGCSLCGEREDGKQPYCVYNCPTQAMAWGDPDDPESDFSVRKAACEAEGMRVYAVHELQKTRKGVYYAQK